MKVESLMAQTPSTLFNFSAISWRTTCILSSSSSSVHLFFLSYYFMLNFAQEQRKVSLEENARGDQGSDAGEGSLGDWSVHVEEGSSSVLCLCGCCELVTSCGFSDLRPRWSVSFFFFFFCFPTHFS
jgi:hypothetical protein